jgi:hypothetical protein
MAIFCGHESGYSRGVNVNVSLFSLIKHYAMKTYGVVEV